MNRIEKKSLKIQSNAERFLKNKRVVEIFSRYGKIVFSGSFALKLMTWNDIDMHILLDKEVDGKKAFMEIISHYFQDKDFLISKIINFLGDYKPQMPRGLYLGLDFLCKRPLETWKLDLWILNKKDFEKNEHFMDKLQKIMTTELREMILDIKYKMMNKKRVPQRGSYELYKLLLKGIRDKKEIIARLQDLGYDIN